ISKVSGASNKIGILCVHAPLSNTAGGDANTQSGVMSAFKNNLYHGWAAKSGRNIYEHTLQSLAGYWWQADVSYNEASPAGYGVMTFDNDDIYAEYNKVTKEEASFQMRNYDGGATYNKVSAYDKMMHGGSRGYKEYTWPSPVKGKLVTRIPDAGAANDDSDKWEVKVGNTAMTRVASDNPVLDVCAASYVFNELKGPQGDANVATDQIWYSSTSYSSSFTVTATHTMKSGWSATYTSTSIISDKTNPIYKGFAYGVRY
ncbi:MAG: calcineurin-like phosphoesterase C-terminal domain-containing protein, partial [Bacteroidales bacterium]|nr:calcineurin-like phosphoesterase C-terminal domain-containing protein [Candidatus Hennigimonas equi]